MWSMRKHALTSSRLTMRLRRLEARRPPVADPPYTPPEPPPGWCEEVLRLLRDYGIEPERLAIVTPHRAQNNAITQRLSHLLAERGGGVTLPVIDTVERLQGAERDVVLFSVTTSDPDHLASAFLNNPNRFNVAITRARHKLVVVGSTAFFAQVPPGETALQANYCFKAFYHLCQEQGSLFVWPSINPLTASPPLECQEQFPSRPSPP